MEEKNHNETNEEEVKRVENEKNKELNEEENFVDINQQFEIFQNIEIDDVLANLIEENNINLVNKTHNSFEEETVPIDNFGSNDMQNIKLSESINIDENINKNNLNYQALFYAENKILLTDNEHKTKSCLNVDSLKDDEYLLKRKSLLVEKDEFLKADDWEFMENFEENEQKFKNIENQINKGDLYNLYETIKKFDITPKNSDDSNIPTIGPISTLEYMVESTFGFDSYSIDYIADHIFSLENYVFRWRSILGDGNCYYRAVIFAFLENMIFERNIILLKHIMNDIEKILDENYLKVHDLPCTTREEILKIKKFLILKIFYLIYELLDSNKSSNDIQKAYEVLIKSFLFCRSFDIGMVFYLRLKIFEYIKFNSFKVYSSQFLVKLGNLLPSEYETESGEFLFDQFIKENLLKLDVDAEKIIIYLTPFVLKMNLKIIIYEFDKNSTVLSKEFPCYLENKHEIILLYRKTHYDLVYESKNFGVHAKELCYYVNLNENLKVVNSSILSRIKYNKNLNIESTALAVKGTEANKSASSKNTECASCHSPINSININICKECLYNELISQIMANYMDFINESMNLFQTGQERQIPALFNQIFNQKQIYIHFNYFTLSKLAFLTDTNINQVIKEVKSKLCLMCSTNIQNNKARLGLPCQCYVCCRNCFDSFFYIVFGKKKSSDNNKCICGYAYNNNDFRAIYSLVENAKSKDQKKIIEAIVMENMLHTCAGGCMEEINTSKKDFHLIKFKDNELTKLLKKKEFQHVICAECLKIRKLREKDILECVLCNTPHRIDKIKRNYSDGDEGCNIL